MQEETQTEWIDWLFVDLDTAAGVHALKCMCVICI